SDYFSEKIQLNLFRISSLRCFYFISFISTLQIQDFSGNSPNGIEFPHRVDKSSDSRFSVYIGLFTFNGILPQFIRFSGSDSENDTRSPGAAQVGPEGRAIVRLGVRQPLRQ
ncbi:hypothetical protein KNN17_10770, partial [Arthrobacter bambusae]|uniref:hypothetical protein n=1 Tax=Arthrobacter bambusae TaxID=1338426 RepID=UPI001F50EB1A